MYFYLTHDISPNMSFPANAEEGDDMEDEIFMAEVSAKLDLVDELVEQYTKGDKKKKRKKGK